MRAAHGSGGERAPRNVEGRIASLIDAAASVADEVGVGRLTTTLVAQRAGASIGTVYRYFPDRSGVIQGLRNRNVSLLHDRMHVMVDRSFDDWGEVVEAVLEGLVGAYGELPGFRAVTTGDWLGDDGVTTLACIERLARASLPPPVSDAVSSESLDGAVRILDALVRSAFDASAHGEQALLDLARRHALHEVGVVEPDWCPEGARSVVREGPSGGAVRLRAR